MLNKVIDLLRYENGEKKLRRVKVTASSRIGDHWRIVGVNLKGKYPHSYRIPVEPLVGPPPNKQDAAYWIPVTPDPEFDA